MQTFMPYESIFKSAHCLDKTRLNSQVKEGMQIENAIADPTYGWQNHPAVRMWRGHSEALRLYCMTMTSVAWGRGINVKVAVNHYFNGVPRPVLAATADIMPSWWGDPAFHASHRSNLLRKDPWWYSHFGWTEPDNLPYVWPVPVPRS